MESAKQYLDSGEYSLAIPRFIHLIGKYPNTPASTEARYWLGVTYSKVKSYQDAMLMLKEYLEMAPEGKFAAEGSALLNELSEEYQSKFWTTEKFENRANELKQQLASNPKNLTVQLELADLYWKRGDYENSGRLYVEIVEDHPEYLKDATIVTRIEPLPTGEYVVLTPAEIQRRAYEDMPLQVFNETAFKSGEDLLTRRPRYYVVTGQCVNRGDSVLYGVQINCSIYGFGSVVLDTSTINIGRLAPGEIRAFSVRFSNFPNIDDIHRHECVGVFER
ncbi:MAG: hypothetical protein AMXMBFR84_06080 [Candidatus Hydrogenedentota bacterium]